MGKTRLALEAGTAQFDKHPDGVYFASLAPILTIDLIVPAVAQALGLAFRPAGDPRQQLLNYLRPQRLLMILDNFEGLLDGVSLVSEILQAAPGVRVLATSRVRLGLPEEHLFHLAGMDFPAWETVADALSYSAVRLFLQGARRTRPGWQPETADLPAVARICRLVEGMPLGILLAAAWVEMLSPAEIAAEVQHGLDFLQAEVRGVSERQRSLRAIFDRTWSLLTPHERDALPALSVFRGGFLREAGQQVAGAGLRDLMGLVNKSLLRRGPAGRYEMHELLRQYAAEKLDESGKAETVRRRHVDILLTLADQSFDELLGPRGADWLHRLTDEKDNIRAALDWCLSSGHAQIGLRMAGYLVPFWDWSSSFTEGRNWLARLLAAAPEAKQEQAWGLKGLGLLAFRQGDFDDAVNTCEESLALAEALNDRRAIAHAALVLAISLQKPSEYARAASLLERSVALYENLDQPNWVATSLECLGCLARKEGDLARARNLFEHALVIQRRLEDKVGLSFALTDLGRILIHFGELDRSQELLREGLAVQLELGDALVFMHLMAFAFLANARGQSLAAVRLLAASDALRETVGGKLEADDRPDHDSNLASLRAQLDTATFNAAWAEGEALTVEQAVALAMSELP